MEFDMPKGETSIIKVIGVGGGGSNAVTHMYNLGIHGVDFAICNTDKQAMDLSPVPNRIPLGPELTEGRGAGSKPAIGRQACIESIEEVRKFLESNTKMLFVTAGMGGGTGTGAAPVIAKTAQEMDILTVGIVTLPFTFEGRQRTSQGMSGLEELKKNVDTLVVISNDKLKQIHGSLTLSQAFSKADSILSTAAKGIAEIITVAGYVNVDFEDVNTVMRDSGVAIMGTAIAEGKDRAKNAIDQALNSPLLEDNDIRGAKHILVNISSGTTEVTMDEIFEITEFVQEEAGYNTNLIWGNSHDAELGEQLSVTVIATGFEHKQHNKAELSNEKIVVPLDENQPGKDNVYETGHNAGENSRTVEFDSVKPAPKNVNQHRRTTSSSSSSSYSYADPYVKAADKEKMMEEGRRRREMEALRREQERKRISNLKLNNPKTVMDMENEPAYLRRNIRLDDVPDASEIDRSQWTISDGEEPEIRQDNSFLHDNVD